MSQHSGFPAPVVMRLITCLLFCLFALAPVQSTGARTCRILFLGAPAGAPEKLQLFDGTATQEVELPKMNLSPVYKLPAGPLVIRLLESPPATPEEVNQDAPKVAVAEDVTDFYLLVSSDPSNKVVPVKMQVIDANTSKFRKGQMLWFNLTENRVGGQVGTEKLVMDANSKTILDAPAAGNDDFLVNLSFRMPGNEQLYPLCETKWLHDPRSRSVHFVITQEGGRTPRILGFPDYREEEKSKR